MATALEEIDLEERVQAAVKPLQKEAMITRNNVGIFPEMLVCGDITMATSCTDLAHRHSVNQISTLWLHST